MEDRLGLVILTHVRSGSRRPALVTDERILSWADLDDESGAVAAGWSGAGVRSGDRVAAVAENGLQLVVAIVAAHRLGVVWVPVNPGYGQAELSHVLTDSGPALVVADEARSDLVRRCGYTAHPLSMVGPPRSFADPDPQALGLLVYTSGTTGRSKGCRLTFENITSGVSALSGLWEIGGTDVIVHALPLFHVHGLCVAFHSALLRGACTRLLDRFSPEGVVRAIGYGGTVFMGVPTMYQRLVRHLDAQPSDAAVLARARLYCSGSAALSPELLARFRDHTGHTIVERYGMSETLITLSNPLRLMEARKPGSVGHPLAGVEIRVVDEHGADVHGGEPGELWVRGAQVMSGYWNDEASTRQVFAPGGWLKTGDLVTRDEEGAVRIIGRLSTDILKVGGYKLSAREIEEAVAALPFVYEVAVIGVPDEEWGQRVVACVVPREPRSEEEILAACAALDLQSAKRPRAVVVLDELPRNAMGKVQKHLLVQRVSAAGTGSLPAR